MWATPALCCLACEVQLEEEEEEEAAEPNVAAPVTEGLSQLESPQLEG
jgi:hypothetical protein